jgi:hypothetical protein
MKTIAGAALRAWRKSRRMRAAPRPANISTNDDADCAKNFAFDSFATALARSVLPVPGGPCSRMPFGTLAPSFLKRFGSRMNSTTSRSSSLASSTPATSSQRTELDDDGAISCGFVRGMYRTIHTTAIAIRPMKMIGSQVRAKPFMPPQNEPLSAGAAVTSGTMRKASSPFMRERVRVASSNFQPSGSSAPGARSTLRSSSLASSQLSSDVSSTVSSNGPGSSMVPPSGWDFATWNGTVQAAEPPSCAAAGAAVSARARSRAAVRRVLLIHYPNRPSVAST